MLFSRAFMCFGLSSHTAIFINGKTPFLNLSRNQDVTDKISVFFIKLYNSFMLIYDSFNVFNSETVIFLVVLCGKQILVACKNGLIYGVFYKYTSWMQTSNFTIFSVDFFAASIALSNKFPNRIAIS